jgi:hypothetical protein
MGGALGRCSALSAVSWSVLSVASRSVETRVVSVQVRLVSVLVGWHAGSRVLGNGGVGFGMKCRAGLGAERRGCVHVSAGMLRTLWALRAASSGRAGMVRARCTIGLGLGRLVELNAGVTARRAAR